MHAGLHHAEKRKKEGKAKFFDHFMIFVGLVAPISLLPQVAMIWINKSADGISLTTWLLLSWVSLMWLIYGIVRKSPALAISNFFMTILNIIVIVGVLAVR